MGTSSFGTKTTLVSAAAAFAILAGSTVGHAAAAGHIDSVQSGTDIQLYLPGQKLLVDVDESKLYPNFKTEVSLTGLKQELASFGASIQARLGWNPSSTAPATQQVANALEIADQAERAHGNDGTAVPSWISKEEPVFNDLVKGPDPNPTPCRGRCLGQRGWTISRYLTTGALAAAIGLSFATGVAVGTIPAVAIGLAIGISIVLFNTATDIYNAMQADATAGISSPNDQARRNAAARLDLAGQSALETAYAETAPSGQAADTTSFDFAESQWTANLEAQDDTAQGQEQVDLVHGAAMIAPSRFGRDTGVVTTFNDNTGIGFIRPDAGGANLFVHFSDINTQYFHTLHVGQRVSYDRTQGSKGPQAVNITPLD